MVKSLMDIALHDITKSYVDYDRTLTVIDKLSYTFEAGRSYAIVGRSGVGKSTLLHLLGALDRPSEGSILFGERDLSKLDGDQMARLRGREIGFIFQFHHLLPEFSALENVMMPLLISGVDEVEAGRRSTALLERVGLGSRVSHRPSQLSGGEQQRVAVARAVVINPRVILADEPTGNLDLDSAMSVQSLVLELHRELNNVLVVVTHSRELASSMSSVLEMGVGGRLTAE